MKKVYLAAAVLALIFGFSYCYKKDKTEKTATEKEAVVNEVKNEEMIVPGYALGEIPAISIPEIPNLSVSENPDAKITLDMAKKISSVPGITISPVKVEDGNIVGGSYSMQIGKNGDGQYSDKNKSVQTDGNGAGQYEDDKITIQRENMDKFLKEVNKLKYVVIKKGHGTYLADKRLSFGATGLLKFLLENEELKNIETHFDFSRILSNASHTRKEKIETTQKYLKELEKNNYYHLFDIFDRKQKRKGIEYQITIVSNCVITEKEAKNYLELSNEKIVMNYAGEVK